MIFLSETDKHLSGLYLRDEWETVLKVVNEILIIKSQLKACNPF
jgi:hypothetical protein